MIVIKIVDNKVYGKCCSVGGNEPMPVNERGHCDGEKVKAIMACELFDIVDMGHGITAWTDDEALFTKKEQYNWPAIALRTAYWTQHRAEIACPCNYPQLFGTVVLLGGTDKDGHQLDLTDEQVKYIKSILG